jgi:hypothetical protein
MHLRRCGVTNRSIVSTALMQVGVQSRSPGYVNCYFSMFFKRICGTAASGVTNHSIVATALMQVVVQSHVLASGNCYFSTFFFKRICGAAALRITAITWRFCQLLLIYVFQTLTPLFVFCFSFIILPSDERRGG